MKTSELHTFKSILTEGIKIKDSETGTVTCSPIACIYIPKIQRAYAQGRISEEDVRKDFLDALFDTLLSEEAKPLELSFLFGSKQAVIRRKSEKDQSSSGLELLDGQQRTTTLFLLHWYIGIKENGLVPDFLNKFTYETRDTSIDFLSKITSTDSNKKEEGEVSEVNSKGNKDHNWITDISAKGEKPSKAIKNNKWFTDDFYCDPTVCAMLTMLDEIDKQYAQRKCSHLWDKLDRLQFYVLMLEEFDMNDELYIKMNSRGLSLIPFENFKASLVKYMKAKERNGLYGTDKTENGQAPFWFDFVSKMDAEWIDIFWKFTPAEGKGNDICKENIPTDDFNTGVRYLSFINNYLFTKAAISEGIVNNEEGELTNFFREVNAAKRLTGWDKYERVFGIMEDREADDSAQSNSPEVSYTVLYKLDKVLTAFQKHGKYIVDQIKADPYGRTDKFDLDNIKFNNYHERVAFGAVTEFIENIPENKSFANQEIKENFERMLRVVFNLLENTRLESVAPAVRRIKQLHDLCIQPGATDVNFYKVLAAPTKENIRAQRYEEILKAREMFDNDGNFLPEWEKAFITAERHPFFKGSILFFFTEKAGDSQDFLNRYNVVKNMFYQNGIHPDYRQPKDHILIRALLGTVNYWENGMKEQFITEGNESKYLKNLIIESEDIRKLFCDFFTQQSFESIDEYLEDSVKNASPKEGESDDFGRLFRRLINSDTSSAIFDWIQDGEEATRHNANHTFAARESKGIYYLNIKRNNYQLVLSNERHLIIPYFVNCHGFSFADKQQESSINGPLGDVTGWNIYLDKQLVCQSGEKYKVQLIFIWDQLAEFRVYGPEIGRLSTEFKVNPEHAHEGYIQISWIRHHLAADKVAIENELKRIEDILIHKF